MRLLFARNRDAVLAVVAARLVALGEKEIASPGRGGEDRA
jgi:hypothetical protein